MYELRLKIWKPFAKGKKNLIKISGYSVFWVEEKHMSEHQGGVRNFEKHIWRLGK